MPKTDLIFFSNWVPLDFVKLQLSSDSDDEVQGCVDVDDDEDFLANAALDPK